MPAESIFGLVDHFYDQFFRRSLNDRIHLATDPAQEAVTAHYRDEYGWLRVEHSLGDRWRSNTFVSAAHGERGRNGEIVSTGLAVGEVNESRRFSNGALHSDWTYQGSADAAWSFGIDVEHERSQIGYLRAVQVAQDVAKSFAGFSVGNGSSSVDPSATFYGAFGSARRRWRSLEAELGLRVDVQRYADDGSRSQLSPRLNFRFDVSPQWKLFGSWGRFTQAQRPHEWRVEALQSAADPSALSIHSVVGLLYQKSATTSWRVEAYRKRWTTLAPYFDNVLNTLSLVPDLQPDRILVTPVDSESSGVEVNARHTLSDATDVWANNSWSRVADEFSRGDVVRSWDQPQALSIGATWKHSPVEISMIAAWHRGWPRTVVGHQLIAGPGDTLLVIGSRNASRWGDFLSLDLRASWSLPFRRSELSTWVELTNATNRRNECCTAVSSDSTGGNLVLDQGYWLPRILNAGATWKFRSIR